MSPFQKKLDLGKTKRADLLDLSALGLLLFSCDLKTWWPRLGLDVMDATAVSTALVV